MTMANLHAEIDDAYLPPLDVSEGEAAFHLAMDGLRSGPLQIPRAVRPSEWIEANIELSKQESSRPGPLRLTGYQRPVADNFADPDVDQITVIKGAQVGWSRVSGAVVCYALAHEATKIAYAQPTDDDAKGFYKDVLEPRFRDVQAMRDIIRTPGRGDVQDTWDEHRYRNGGVLYMRGAASDDSFRRISSRINIGDEVDADAWRGTDGDNQGDKFELFRTRGTDFWDSKLAIGSTPLIRDTSLIWREWQLSDQRRLHIRCPHCGCLQHMKWGGKDTTYGFKWTTSDRGDVEDVWYQCEGLDDDGTPLKCRIDEHLKDDLIEAGEFIPTAIPNRPGHRGYHWPQWHSMAPKASWHTIVSQWLSAQGNPERLRVFFNNILGEPWDDLSSIASTMDSVSDMATPYASEVPDDVILLTAGVDCQTNKEGGHLEQIASREVSIYGWSRHEMPRLIGHWVVLGEPGEAESEARLDEILSRAYKKRDGSEFFVQASAEDLGGHYGDAVRARASSRMKKNVWAIKGRNITLGQRSASVWPRKVSRDPKKGSWYMIDTQLAKDAVGRKLRVRGPGGPMFPASMSAPFFEDLAAEKLITDKQGRRYWKRTRKTVTGEAWDCLVYAYAALCGLKASFRKWRDLNLAARNLGIVETPHDPETGEVLQTAGYDGPDLSAMRDQTESIEFEVALTPAAASASLDDVRPAQPEAQTVAPAVPVKRRPRVMRVGRWG